MFICTITFHVVTLAVTRNLSNPVTLGETVPTKSSLWHLIKSSIILIPVLQIFLIRKWFVVKVYSERYLVHLKFFLNKLITNCSFPHCWCLLDDTEKHKDKIQSFIIEESKSFALAFTKVYLFYIKDIFIIFYCHIAYWLKVHDKFLPVDKCYRTSHSSKHPTTHVNQRGSCSNESQLQ